MDDIKQKFSGLLNKLGNQSKLSLHSPVSDEVDCQFTDKDVTNKASNRVEVTNKVEPPDIPSDEDILSCVEKEYFNEGGFDPSRHELKKLSQKLDSDALLRDGQRLRQQQKVVSKKLLNLISQKQSACKEEFEKIQGLQRLLQETLAVCRLGRAQLGTGKQQLTTASLGILANYRKRQLLLSLLHSLNTIKTLQQSEEHLQQLLNDGYYEAAMTQLLECQASAASFRRFSCVAALNGKLQDTLVMAEEQLDVALAKVCEHFDAERYGQLQAAYAQLGKTQTAMDQLHMHFTSAIQNTALNTVQRFASPPGGTASSLGGKQYSELCKNVSEDNFISCLQELCRSLWKIVCSHHRVGLWHQKHSPDSSMPGGVGDFEASLTREYIRQKLESMQARVWQDVQARFSTFLLASNLACFKFDNFLQVLSLVHRLMEVGEEFCGSHSEELQKSVRQQSINYFAKYHAGCLEELRIFLENETWTPCPVKKYFTCLQLQEFRSLRGAIQNIHLREQQQTQQSPDSSNQSQDGSSVAGGYLARFAESGSPFDVVTNDLQEEDILANVMDEPSGYFSDESDEDVPDELKGDFVDEGHGEIGPGTRPPPVSKNHRTHAQGPLLTNTTLTVLRHCGKYLQMSRLLRTVAMDVIISLSQLFQYYLYAVHAFFTTDLPSDSSSLYSIKLQASLKRVCSDLILTSNNIQSMSQEDKNKVPQPHVSPLVNLNEPENLFGLAERVVAVESLVVLAEQLKALQPYLEHLVRHEPRKHYVPQFFLQIVAEASNLRMPVYSCVALRAVDLRSMLSMMSRVNWEPKEVESQHSQYVDFLLREMQIFSMRLEEVSKQVHISKDVYNTLWDALILISNNTFVEGFGNAKKCSTGGRGLMQLDFTQFVSKLEQLTSLRPIPYKDYVENYVKAYYLPEEQLEKWIKDHLQYSSKQLLTLVHCACQNNKKARQRLSTLVEELERAGSVR